MRKSSRNARPEEKTGLARIEVEGFKSLAKRTSAEIRPLTVLAGANSSGKSSLMQPLLLLKQTLDATFDPGPLLLDGPNVKFTSSEQFFSRTLQTSPPSFSIALAFEHSIKVDFGFRRSKPEGITLAEMTWIGDSLETRLQPGMTDAQIEKVVPRSLLDALSHMIRDRERITFELIRDRCFLDVAARMPVQLPLFLNNYIIDSSQGKGQSSKVRRDASLFAPLREGAQHRLRRVIHVPGWRGRPERTYPVTGIGPSFPGVFQTYVASLIHHWKADGDIRLEQLADMLRELELTWKVEPKPIDETQVELKVGRLPKPRRGGARDLVSIADVGFGVSQVLPVLVSLLVAAPDQLVYIEQPELHLHPRAQTLLAGVIAQAARRGVRVVIETHSSLLLLGIQTLVAEGTLDPALVKLHWFRRKEDGSTEITSADLDEEGAFGQEWPEDFADVELDAQKRFLDAASRHAGA